MAFWSQSRQDRKKHGKTFAKINRIIVIIDKYLQNYGINSAYAEKGILDF